MQPPYRPPTMGGIRPLTSVGHPHLKYKRGESLRFAKRTEDIRMPAKPRHALAPLPPRPQRWIRAGAAAVATIALAVSGLAIGTTAATAATTGIFPDDLKPRVVRTRSQLRRPRGEILAHAVRTSRRTAVLPGPEGHRGHDSDVVVLDRIRPCQRLIQAERHGRLAHSHPPQAGAADGRKDVHRLLPGTEGRLRRHGAQPLEEPRRRGLLASRQRRCV